jgi:hypothetical protein
MSHVDCGRERDALPTGKLRVEYLDDFRDARGEPQECFRDFLINKANFSLVEDYKRGDVCVALRQIEGLRRTVQDDFVFQSLNSLRSNNNHPSLWSHPEHAAGIGTGVYQAAMFPQYVELVEGPNGVISSLVWSERFDRGSLPPGQPLFAFDACQRIDHTLVGGKKWKVRIRTRLVAVATTKRCGKQIESGPDTVYDDPNFSVHNGVKWPHQIGYQKMLASLRIKLGLDFIRVVLIPGNEFVLEHWNLGSGPINAGLSV